MSAGTSEIFCLICLLICSCTAQKITAELGQNVILPCKVPNNNNNINDITAVGWKRPDLDPDYVLLYRDGRFDPNNQHRSYQNRVDLQDKEMKDGDVSLILKNVTKNDTGTYVCRVSQKGKTEPFSIITLKVYLSALEITAELGHDVILPCKVPNNNNINNITAVEWNRPDLGPDHVLVYRDGHINPENQNPSYQNRVDLQDKEMKDRDVSLILKNVKMEDTGKYECLVSQKGKKYLINIITLKVRPSDDSWKTIVGVVVVIILLILAVGLAYKIRQNSERKTLFNALQEVIQRLKEEEQKNEAQQNEQVKLKRSHSDACIQLQEEKRKNETLENQLEELKGSYSDIINQLQEGKLRNEDLMHQLMKQKGNNPETNNLLQQEKQKNEALMNKVEKKLKRSNSDPSIELQWVTQRNEFLERRLMKMEQMGTKTAEDAHK